MLKTILPTALLLCAVIQQAELSNKWRNPSRPEILRMIGGDVSERPLHLERCSQSSLPETCSFALDEDINQEPWSNECAITAADEAPYWDARLENPAYVTKVHIFGIKNIAERGQDALTHFQLMVGDHICVNYKSKTSFVNKTFACDSFGDNIRIESKKNHSVLALCEVVAFGQYVSLDRYHTTILPYEDCSMSGIQSKNCHGALDGILDQTMKMCAVTEEEPAPFFEVILHVPSQVRRIVVFNAECCKEKMSSFEIYVNNQLCIKHENPNSFSKQEFFCGRYGDRVRFVLTKAGDKNQLMLCELELYGYPTQFRPNSNIEYIGCFREKRLRRDMQKMVAMDNMSLEKCERMCRRLKKPYFGLQLGKQCWCSERYGMYGEISRGDCWMQCDGNREQNCGAKLVNAVYKLN